ncbi:acyl carrier protein [Actinophytocola algeriensis]|uniref:Acyl carrier protein n=1 Tax=Actinophytocola algeriensis TaxID=1768010 RepID=A0A7W7QCK3_9PSEU|nr:acyl carrier protein [Actinophytocola algeriensis]MBB4910646.1 acyl carrier protein [Actinophytocola algeriensis]MBE1473639.1 acyl carrier protein [Actinophytocola algeriensis]
MSDVDTEIAELIAETSGGAVGKDLALDEQSNLLEKGFSSLSFLQLIDALETRYGVYIDLEEDTTFLGRVSGIVRFLKDQNVV